MLKFGTFFFLLSNLTCCSNIQFKQNLFAPENQLFLEGKFSQIEEKQTYAIQEAGWGKLVERASQMVAFPFAMFQGANSLEEQYEKSLLKISQGKQLQSEIPVKELLESDDSEVRSLALEMTEEVKLLLKHLNDPDDFVRMQAVERLKDYPSTEVVAAIEKVVREDPEEFVRLEGTRSLGELKFPESLNTLAFCLKDPMDHIRRGAALALVHYPAEQVVPLLTPLLDDPIFFVREAAMDSLSKLLSSKVAETQFFGYDPEAPSKKRKAAMAQLLKWWNSQRNKE